MKHSILFLTLLCTPPLFAADKAEDAAKRAASTVVLDETGVKNLKIETVEVEETDFEKTIFSLGRIEAVPTRRSGVSSRIPGRIVELKAAIGDVVKAGDEVLKLESRQAGDPPPIIPIKATMSGIVTESDVRLGDPVEPDKALLGITDLSEVYAIARVPEHLAGQFKPGAVAHIKVAALPEEKFEGTLLRFGTSADKESGTLDAIFRLANPSLTLRPAMRAEFSIVLGRRSGVMTVPRIALQGDAASRTIYVKDFDLKNAFIKTSVTVGEINDRYAEILSGVLPGDEVVTRGAYSLAFAGGGSVSLKAALDAAHGHEHAADGGELKPGEKSAKPGAEGDEHGHAEGMSPLTQFSLAGNALLLLLLIVAMLGRGKKVDDEPAPAKAKAEQPPTAEAKH